MMRPELMRIRDIIAALREHHTSGCEESRDGGCDCGDLIRTTCLRCLADELEHRLVDKLDTVRPPA